MTSPDLLAGLRAGLLVGPTASGKSALALALAEREGAEIVSLDSMQVYRGMDVGTAKPAPAERARVRHHMLDLVGPEERYDVQRYLADLAPVVDDLRARGARVLFTGGTGFYLKALLAGLHAGPPADPGLRARLEARARELGAEALHRELAGVDPASAARIHAHDVRRVVRALEVREQTGEPLSSRQREWGWHGARPAPRTSVPIVGLDRPDGELDARIAGRARAMLDAGWVEEALAIRDGPGFGETAVQALGYREVLALADGRLDREACLRSIALRTRRFARKQRTWYRKIPGVRWIAPGDQSAIIDLPRTLGFIDSG